MKSTRFFLINILVVVIIAGGVIGGFWYYNQLNQYYKTDDAMVQAPETDITATASGILTKILVAPGDKVTAGEVVANVAAGQAVANVTSVADGTVISIPLKVGDLVTPGQNVAVLASLDKVYIAANVDETRIVDVKPGQTVDITIDAFAGTKFTGTVTSIGNVTESQLSILPTINASGSYTKVTQRIPVVISLDSTAGQALRPGMNTSITIHVK